MVGSGNSSRAEMPLLSENGADGAARGSGSVRPTSRVDLVPANPGVTVASPTRARMAALPDPPASPAILLRRPGPAAALIKLPDRAGGCGLAAGAGETGRGLRLSGCAPLANRISMRRYGPGCGERVRRNPGAPCQLPATRAVQGAGLHRPAFPGKGSSRQLNVGRTRRNNGR